MSQSWRYQLDFQGTIFELEEGDTTVGRSRSCDVSINDASVSRRHATLLVSPGRLEVEDLGSSNGTFVNGRRLTRREQLTDSDTVCFGEAELGVRIILPEGFETTRLPQTPPDQPGEATFFLQKESVKLAQQLLEQEEGGDDEDAYPDGDPEDGAPPAGPGPAAGRPAAAGPHADTGAGESVADPVVPESEPDGEMLPSLEDLDELIGAPPTGDTASAGPSVSRRLRPSGFWIRLVAAVFDGLWIGAVQVATGFLPPRLSAPLPEPLLLAGPPGLGLLVTLVGWAVWGSTPGKRVLGLYVAGLDGRRGIGWGRAALRCLGYLLSCLTIGVGFLLIAFSRSKRGLHDHIAGTYVGR